MHKIVHTQLQLYPISFSWFSSYAERMNDQRMKVDDQRMKRRNYAMHVLRSLDNNPEYLNRDMFSDKTIFHTCGHVDKHNCRIWGVENPHVVHEVEKDCSKVNVRCGLMRNRVVGPFIFVGKSVTGHVYLDMLQLFVAPQVEVCQPNFIFQQDGAPPHWSCDGRSFLYAWVPDRWLGRDGPISWPMRSPHLTPLNVFFFVCGFM